MLIVRRVIFAKYGRATGTLTRYVSQNPNLSFGLLILVTVSLAAIFASVIGQVDPLKLDVQHRLEGPSRSHWFGTDHLGRSVYSRTIHGGRLSLVVGASVVAITTVIGGLLGMIAGYDRRMDALLMRVLDGVMAFPGLLLAMALMAIWGASLQNVIIAISVSASPSMARVMRSAVLSLRERPYVEAARAEGASTWRILMVHIAPNTLAPMTIQTTFLLAIAMLTEAGLSFIGVGVPPSVPSWGNMVSTGRMYQEVAPWVVIFPGVVLTLTVLAANLVGDGLRDKLDPRLRGKL